MIRPAQQQSKAKLRAVLYLRQSTYREESISLELQETAARAHAERMGYEVVAVEADPGISGRTWNRPAVQRVMHMLETGEAERVVLWKWSRLSRDDYDWAVARKIARTAGGRIESATEPNDEETPEGRLMLSQMIAFAVYESDRIGSVWKETHARRLRLGLPHSGVARFGYDRDASGGYSPSESTGPVLAAMYERYVAGDGLTRIARWANAEGHRTLAGRLWSRVSVTQMLDSGFGAGLLIRRGPDRHSGPSGHEYLPAAHEGVIDSELWEAYCRRRADVPRPARVAEPGYMLSGLVRCADCGGTMHHTKQDGASAYRCGRKQNYGDVKGMAIRASHLEVVVREWVMALADDLDGLARAEAAQTERRVRAINDRSLIEGSIAVRDAKIAQVTLEWMDKKLPDIAYRVTLDRLTAERESLVARLATATRDSTAEVDVRNVAVKLVEIWDRMEPAELNRMLRELIVCVRVHRPVRPGVGVWRDRIEVVPVFSD